MANFGFVNDLSFPSPPNRGRSAYANMVNTSVNLANTSVIGSITCSTTIQFPSPVYATSTSFVPFSNSTLTVPRSSVLHNMSCSQRNWQHEVPPSMPWATAYPSPANVFTLGDASVGPNASGCDEAKTRNLKRRSADNEVFDSPNRKVFINEDRVAAGMRNLQLGAVANSNSCANSDRNQSWFYTQSPVAANTPIDTVNGYQETEEMLDANAETGINTSQISGPRLTLSEELQAGLARKDVMQKLYANEIAKQNKQLVLWTPPPGNQIKDILRATAFARVDQSNSSAENVSQSANEMECTHQSNLTVNSMDSSDLSACLPDVGTRTLVATSHAARVDKSRTLDLVDMGSSPTAVSEPSVVSAVLNGLKTSSAASISGASPVSHLATDFTRSGTNNNNHVTLNGNSSVSMAANASPSANFTTPPRNGVNGFPIVNSLMNAFTTTSCSPTGSASITDQSAASRQMHPLTPASHVSLSNMAATDSVIADMQMDDDSLDL